MHDETFSGVVLGEIDKAEKGKTLVVLTAEKGTVYVDAPGAHKLAASYLKSAQLFAYSRFFCYAKKGYFLLKEASLFEDFFDLRYDYVGYCLAAYVAEVALSVAVDKADCQNIMSLTLNTLYAITKKLYPYEHMRYVFEMRLATLLGFEPDVEYCPFCDGQNGEKHMMFDLEDGIVCCADCLPDEADRLVCCKITKSALLAIKYIVSAPAKQIFSFGTDDATAKCLSDVCQKYLHLRTEKRYKSLPVYKNALKSSGDIK